MPPRLACYLIRALSNLSGNIRIFTKFSILADSAIFGLRGHGLNCIFVCKLADDDVTSGQKTPCLPGGQYGEFPIFRIFGLKLLSVFSRLDNKQGGIL